MVPELVEGCHLGLFSRSVNLLCNALQWSIWSNNEPRVHHFTSLEMCGALLNKFRDLEITTKKIIPGDMPFLFEEVDNKFLCLPKSIINFGDTQSIFGGKKARLCELINTGKPLKMFASENSAHFLRRPPLSLIFLYHICVVSLLRCPPLKVVLIFRGGPPLSLIFYHICVVFYQYLYFPYGLI